MSTLHSSIRATAPAGLLATHGVSKNLEARSEHCANLPFDHAESIAVDLTGEAELPEAGLEALEALAFVLLAQPQIEVNLGWDLQDLVAEVAERRGILAGPEAEMGFLRLALLERSGDAALKVLIEHRRQHHKVTGERVNELRGYAESWARRGRNERAIQCYEEALRLQPWRAELNANISRLLEAKRERRWGVAKGLAWSTLMVLFLLGGLSVWSLDQRIQVRYAAVPLADLEDLDTLRVRHEALSTLQAQFPLWTGALKVRRELLELELIEEKHAWRIEQEATERARADRLDDHRATTLREQALWHLQAGDWDEAGALLERSLRTASDSWSLRSRVELDLEEVRRGPQGR